jgi:predicted alpha/beta-fold hydrolase
MVATFHALAARGIRAFGLNFRSCSGEPNRTARLYHSGETGDIRFMVELLLERTGGRPVGAIGFSLGGNALLKYLGEEGADARGRIAGAVAVSVPFDLGAGADALDGSAIGRFYTRRFLASLAPKALDTIARHDVACDADRIRKARSFREFDDAATAPLHGFESAVDYYSRCSSARWIERVRVPALLIQSRDDPVQPDGGRIALEAASANPDIQAIVTDRGGHVGFLAGPPWRMRSWVEAAAAEWIADGVRATRTGESMSSQPARPRAAP